MASAVDVNGNPLNVGDSVVVLIGEVLESEATGNVVRLKLPSGDGMVCAGDQLERISGTSITDAIATAVGPASITSAMLVDADGNALTTELVKIGRAHV